MMNLSRRRFLKISAGTIAAAGALEPSIHVIAGSEKPLEKGIRAVPTFCNICFWQCGAIATVRDGKLWKIEGNPRDPLSHGRLCPRGTGGIGAHFDPDRLRSPLLRVSERGEEKWKAVTWDEALTFVAERMQKIKAEYGPESFAAFIHGLGGTFFKHTLRAYGTDNIAAPSFAQCRGPRDVGFTLTYGDDVSALERTDIENAQCLVLIGSHIGENMHNTQVQELADAVGKGAQLVVVDPRFSVAAGKARYWLPVKPGTDVALLLAWMNVIVEEKRYDAEYLAKYATGLDELKAHVAGKTPEWAWPLTGVRPELIRESARFIAAARPASLVHPGRHTTWTGDDTQRARAMAILAALLGSWGRRGGYLSTGAVSLAGYPVQAPAGAVRPAADKPKQGGYPVADEVLASGLCDATRPGFAMYDMKAWIVYGTNLMQSLPAPQETVKAVQGLDFLVAIDVLPAEICGWADVVLPEATYLERDDDLAAPRWKTPFVAIRQAAVEPLYDSRPGWWIAKEMGKAVGLGAHFPWKDAAEFVETRARASGLDVAELRRKGALAGKRIATCEEEGAPPPISTESGKIQLHSAELAKLGFDPIPSFYPPEEGPPGSFRLLMGRAPTHTFGRTANNRLLAEPYPENEVWINADAARALPTPVRNGDRVMLVNQDGVKSGPVRAKVTERIRGDCVYLVHGWGHTARGLRYARGRGASTSALTTRYKVDPIMGGTGMNVNFVRLEPAERSA